MSLTLGRYELIVRPITGAHREYVVGEFTFEVDHGEDGVVDFYDVNHELDNVFKTSTDIPPITEA